MKFGVSVSFGVAVCCLISGTSALSLQSPHWSLERPENCPHVNNETHECSSIVSTERVCLSIHCCPSWEDEGSSSEEEDSTDSVADSTSCEHGRCFYFGRCTLYHCAYRCCDGYDRDYAGRCQNETGELECQNYGEIGWDMQREYYCECPAGFRGRSCEIPECSCENLGECSVMDGFPHCVCPSGFTGHRCELAECHPPCENGGSCMSDGHISVCKCPHGFVGETCNLSFENSERCPTPEYNRGQLMDDIRIDCGLDSDCPGETLCCNEGSNLICRRPETDVCKLENGKEYDVGQSWSTDPCENCECYAGGRHGCYWMSCAYPSCGEGQEPITHEDVCCPYCPENETGELECQNNGNLGWNLQRGYYCACPAGFRGRSCEIPEPIRCVHKGVVYADGIGFKDDCNDCLCDGGHVSCTEMACPPNQCITDNGEVYESGSRFKVDCNTCECSDGDLFCTEINCGTDAEGCKYNGTYYKSGDTFKMDCNTCFCREGVLGCTKMACLCNTLECQNYGTCMVKHGQHYCACRLPFIGKLCEIKFENPENCPIPEAWTRNSNRSCKINCDSSSDCKEDDICCKEGCHKICRSPKNTVCHHDGQVFQPGEKYSSNPCEDCICDESGFMACAMQRCAMPVCSNGERPINIPDKCCPVCPTGPTSPTIKCPTGKIEIQAPKCNADRMIQAPKRNAGRIFLTWNITMVKAKSSEGKALQVKYKPEYVEHCKCYDSDKAVKWFEAYVTDKGVTERCRVAYVVKDTIAPVFLSCPTDMYVFEDEAITYKKPSYTDNVAIVAEQCDMDPTNKTYKPGVYKFRYSIWDFDRNVATCFFKLSVSRRDTPFADLPQGLKNRSSDKMNAALIAAPIASLLAIIILVVVFLLCCRFRRARENVSSPSQSSGSRAGYDSNIYAVPGDILVPDYKAFPPNPPAYHKDNMEINSDYTFLPPPAYKEVAELRVPMSYENPDYASIGSAKTPTDSDI